MGPRSRWTSSHDKVVGIIGTGATAVQAVPKLAEAAKQLYVFQRTPSSVSPRNQRPHRPRVVRRDGDEPGLARAAHGELHRDDDRQATRRSTWSHDGWTELFHVDTEAPPRDEAEARRCSSSLDFQQMEQVRQRIVDDRRGPGHRAKL